MFTVNPSIVQQIRTNWLGKDYAGNIGEFLGDVKADAVETVEGW